MNNLGFFCEFRLKTMPGWRQLPFCGQFYVQFWVPRLKMPGKVGSRKT